MKLSDYVSFVKGKKPSTFDNKGKQYLSIEVIEGNESIFTNDTKCIDCNKTDVLMVMDGASSGKVYIGNEGFVGSTLAKLSINNINPYYLYTFLEFHYDDIKSNNTGSAIPHANKKAILDLDIPSLEIKYTLIFNNLLCLTIYYKEKLNELKKIKSNLLKKYFG